MKCIVVIGRSKMKKTISLTSCLGEISPRHLVFQQFERSFGEPAPNTWSELTQTKALLLLHRIRGEGGACFDPQGIMLPQGTPEIRFGMNKNLTQSIVRTRVGLTQKVKDSLEATFERIKGVPYDMSSGRRPEFITRTSKNTNLALTEDLVHRRQDTTSVSPKYPKQVIVYDITKKI